MMYYFHIISYIKVADMKAIISQMPCVFFCEQTAHRNVMSKYDEWIHEEIQPSSLLYIKRCGLKKYGEMKCFITSCTRKSSNVAF